MLTCLGIKYCVDMKVVLQLLKKSSYNFFGRDIFLK
jgi:hypothetical protein